ncbi:hypothetical protein ACU635_31835 [[Actinomadura] parvosata]|uniref:hypothetical protein n=1 Tax=[Actinomadura] parvosata TaxID=1955412 RepID=UPI00406CD9DC
MRTRPPGRTGIQVSPYCLGTMMFAGSESEETLAALDGRYRKGGQAEPPRRRLAWAPRHIVAYDPPAVTTAALRRRPIGERAA